MYQRENMVIQENNTDLLKNRNEQHMYGHEK
jgi:hypothetical protein